MQKKRKAGEEVQEEITFSFETLPNIQKELLFITMNEYKSKYLNLCKEVVVEEEIVLLRNELSEKQKMIEKLSGRFYSLALLRNENVGQREGEEGDGTEKVDADENINGKQENVEIVERFEQANQRLRQRIRELEIVNSSLAQVDHGRVAKLEELDVEVLKEIKVIELNNEIVALKSQYASLDQEINSFKTSIADYVEQIDHFSIEKNEYIKSIETEESGKIKVLEKDFSRLEAELIRIRGERDELQSKLKKEKDDKQIHVMEIRIKVLEMQLYKHRLDHIVDVETEKITKEVEFVGYLEQKIADLSREKNTATSAPVPASSELEKVTKVKEYLTKELDRITQDYTQLIEGEERKEMLKKRNKLEQKLKDLHKQLSISNNKCVALTKQVEKSNQLTQLTNEKYENLLLQNSLLQKESNQLNSQQNSNLNVINDLEQKLFNLAQKVEALNLSKHKLLEAMSTKNDSMRSLEEKVHQVTTETAILNSRIESLEKEIAQKNDRLTQIETTGMDTQQLELLQSYKLALQCRSCCLNFKSHVITRCYHMFCKECLDSRIETRQRKCPTCGEGFGTGDVKAVYM